jgi:hypothetical protein
MSLSMVIARYTIINYIELQTTTTTQLYSTTTENTTTKRTTTQL